MATIHLVFPSLVLACLATAQDPPPPPCGFPVLTSTATITFSDAQSSLCDFYVPNVAAPATGWPAVLAMHGSDGTRTIPEIVGIGNYLAAAGYVVYAFDGRNSGTTQERDFLDCAESHALAQAVLGAGVIDPARLAVTGLSGGGRKSYLSAAWSGKPMPFAGFAVHPTILAVAPEIATIDAAASAVPRGTLAADSIVIGQPITHPPVAAIALGDYATVLTLVDTQFNQDLLTELATSTVPILSMVAMQDFKIFNNPANDWLLNFVTAPKRLFLSTGGHSTIGNEMERSLMQDLRRRWFDRFLKSIVNGVDLEPLAELGMQPVSTPLHLNTTTIWEHRQSPVWPPAATTRYHLSGTQALSPVPPAAANLTHIVTHVVPAGYDIAAYIDLGGAGPGGGLEPLAVLANIAPDVELFGTIALGQDMEIVGRPVVELSVTDTTGFFQLTAVLAHTDPGGVTHWITAGTTGVRSGVAGPTTVRIELGDVAALVPEGSSLRLRITNICDIQGPGSRRIRYVPYFTSTATRLDLGPGVANHLDLPMRPYRPDLSPRLARVPATGGFAHSLDLSGGLLRAGQVYLVLLGCSGEAPGTTILGQPVPLNVDWCSNVGISALNTAFMPMTLGALDALGNATPGFALPALYAPAVAGFRFTFTGLVFDPAGGIDDIAGPATLVIGQ